jgi:hypothetical protein
MAIRYPIKTDGTSLKYDDGSGEDNFDVPQSETIVEKNDNYQIISGDNGKIISMTVGEKVVTLPKATTGFKITIVNNVSSGYPNIKIDRGDDNDTIRFIDSPGVSVYLSNRGQNATFLAVDNSNWFVIASDKNGPDTDIEPTPV